MLVEVRAHSDAICSIKGKTNNFKRKLQPDLEWERETDENLGSGIQVGKKGHMSLFSHWLSPDSKFLPCQLGRKLNLLPRLVLSPESRGCTSEQPILSASSLGARHCSKYLHVWTHSTLVTILRRVMWMPPIYRWRNWDPERFRNLPKITQL